jgi:hypothetical protein
MTRIRIVGSARLVRSRKQKIISRVHKSLRTVHAMTTHRYRPHAGALKQIHDYFSELKFYALQMINPSLLNICNITSTYIYVYYSYKHRLISSP